MEELEDWTLQGYKLVDDIYTEVPHGFTITNGCLTAEDVYVNWTGPVHGDLFEVRRALHNSTVAYGTWSFDWRESQSREAFDTIEFILTDLEYEYNLTGKPQHPQMNGYTLVIDTILSDVIIFEKYFGSNRYWLKRFSFLTSPDETYHFDITRNASGAFGIFINSELVFDFNDNTVKSSEKFSFISFQGNSSIDNIVVSDSINGISTDTKLGYELVLSGIGVGSAIVVIAIAVYLKRKK